MNNLPYIPNVQSVVPQNMNNIQNMNIINVLNTLCNRIDYLSNVNNMLTLEVAQLKQKVRLESCKQELDDLKVNVCMAGDMNAITNILLEKFTKLENRIIELETVPKVLGTKDPIDMSNATLNVSSNVTFDVPQALLDLATPVDSPVGSHVEPLSKKRKAMDNTDLLRLLNTIESKPHSVYPFRSDARSNQKLITVDGTTLGLVYEIDTKKKDNDYCIQLSSINGCKRMNWEKFFDDATYCMANIENKRGNKWCYLITMKGLIKMIRASFDTEYNTYFTFRDEQEKIGYWSSLLKELEQVSTIWCFDHSK